jgi:hypothetical protein
VTGPTEEQVDLAEFITELSVEFDVRAAERHEMGAKKYGPGKFLTVDTIEEALQEIIDLANYARYTFIKLRLLQESLAAHVPSEPVNTGFVTSATATRVKPEDGR